MPLTERDEIRVRQFLQRLESGLIEGMKAYVTYHDSNLASTPSDPTGDGTTGGWHREPTEASNWMSVKTALKDTAGTWGTPIRVFGLQGTETAGVGLSADIPKLEQITFIGDGSSKVGWTAGTVTYNGSSYAIAVKAVGDGSTDAYIYWDDADGQTSFKTTGTFATAIAANHWVVCINDSGKAIPATSHRIIHGGLIQAATIIAAHISVANLAAISAALGSITSGVITLSLGGDTRLRIDSSGLYISNNAGGNWSAVIYNDDGTVKISADEIKAGTLLADRINEGTLVGVTSDNTITLAKLLSRTDAESDVGWGTIQLPNTSDFCSVANANQEIMGSMWVRKEENAEYIGSVRAKLYILDTDGAPTAHPTISSYTFVADSDAVSFESGDPQWTVAGGAFSFTGLTIGRGYKICYQLYSSDGKDVHGGCNGVFRENFASSLAK